MTLHSRSKAGIPHKKHIPTQETARQVMTMVGYGIRQEDIAAFLKLHPKTLRAHYRHELDVGATAANLAVVQALFRNATKNESVQAQVWWTKARMGWREAQDMNLTGNTPIMVVTGVTRELPASFGKGAAASTAAVAPTRNIKDGDWSVDPDD